MFMNIVVLLVFLAIVAADVKENAVSAKNSFISYMSTRESTASTQQAHKGLRAQGNNQVTAENHGDSVMGDYAIISTYRNKFFCGGNRVFSEIFKVGACIPYVDKGVLTYFKPECYINTGVMSGTFHMDSECMTAVVGVTPTLRSDECMSSMLGTCLTKNDFAQAFRNTEYETYNVMWSAENYKDAEKSDFKTMMYAYTDYHWTYADVINLGVDDRKKCNKDLIMTPGACVDTTEARSATVVPTSVSEAKVNLYSKLNGAGEAETSHAVAEVFKCDALMDTWCAYRFFVNAWAKTVGY